MPRRACSVLHTFRIFSEGRNRLLITCSCLFSHWTWLSVFYYELGSSFFRLVFRQYFLQGPAVSTPPLYHVCSCWCECRGCASWTISTRWWRSSADWRTAASPDSARPTRTFRTRRRRSVYQTDCAAASLQSVVSALAKLQRIQNTAARVVFNTQRLIRLTATLITWFRRLLLLLLAYLICVLIFLFCNF